MLRLKAKDLQDFQMPILFISWKGNIYVWNSRPLENDKGSWWYMGDYQSINQSVSLYSTQNQHESIVDDSYLYSGPNKISQHTVNYYIQSWSSICFSLLENPKSWIWNSSSSSDWWPDQEGKLDTRGNALILYYRLKRIKGR